jgi:serine/threonine protein kinase
MDRNGGEVVAKHLVFGKRRVTHDQQLIFTRALDTLGGLLHPCILPLMGAGQISGDEGVLFLPYMTHGSLAAVLSTEPKPSWWGPSVVAIMVIGIVMGMRYAHAQGVVHGSLKPNNVLLDGAHHIRICDFGALEWAKAGVAREVPNDAAFYIDQGVPEDEEDDTGFCEDVYAFGLIFYEIMMIGKSSHDVMKRITLNKMLSGIRPDISKDFSEWVRGLIDDCWAPNPKHRPSFETIYQLFEKHHYQIQNGVKQDEVQSYIRYMSELARERSL